jgi:AAA+ superfamily predicted ATPase
VPTFEIVNKTTIVYWHQRKGQYMIDVVMEFKNSLFGAVVVVEKDGMVGLINEKMLYEGLPEVHVDEPGYKTRNEDDAIVVETDEKRERSIKSRHYIERWVIEKIARVLVSEALVQNRNHLLYAFKNFDTTNTDDDFTIFANMVKSTRPFVVFESHIPYIEDVIADILLRTTLKSCSKLSPDLKQSQGGVLEVPSFSNHSLVVLPMYGFTGVSNDYQIGYQITTSEAIFLVGCSSLYNLPTTFREMCDMVIKLPDINPKNFRKVIEAIFEEPFPEDIPSESLFWTKLLLPNDIVQANAMQLPIRETIDYLAKRIAEREEKVSTGDFPKLDELHGLGEAKDAALDLIIDIKDAICGKISWNDVDKGLLIVGPPGTGKTTLAKAIARESKIKFINVSAAKWQTVEHLGHHLAAISNDFEMARRYSPCILFIDEFDSLGRRSTNDKNSVYQNMVVNAILQEIQGFIEKEKVIVFGATNFESLIDPALVRSGRLDKIVRVNYPNVNALESIYTYYLKHYHVFDVCEELDMRNLAIMSLGLTGADIEKHVRGAVRRARRAGVKLNQKHFIDEITGANISDNNGKRLTIDELKRIAVHESGHAMVGILNKSVHGQTSYISIIPRNDGRMGFVVNEPSESAFKTYKDYVDILELMLGGRAAEEVIFGKEGVSSGAGGSEDSDLSKASNIAGAMVTKFGFGKKSGLFYSNELMPELRQEANELLQSVYISVVEKLMVKKDLLLHLSELLIEKQEITGNQLRELLLDKID